MLILGVDTGGTFTDFVLYDDAALRIHKVLSTPAAPERAILQGIDELGLSARLAQLHLVHGSTVATNAALEGKGVRTLYIGNRGLRDLLTLGRQARAELYNLQPHGASPPVPDELCLETGGRLAADGSVVEPLTDADLAELRAAAKRLAPRAVAINLLFSYRDDRFERAIEAALPSTLFISRSSAVLPETREYERGIVLVNPTKVPQQATVPLSKARRYRDVFAGTEGEGGALSLEMPPESGRVFLWR